MGNEILKAVLNAREERWNLRCTLSEKYASTIISTTICLPHLARTAEDFKQFLHYSCEELSAYLNGHGCKIIHAEKIDGEDGACVFLCTDEDAIKVKKLTCDFEQKSAVFRILDIDIMTSNGTAISRSDINLPPRKCFICDEYAAVCVAGRRHDSEEVFKKVNEYRELIKM